MADRVLKLKSFEIAVSSNTTVANSTTTINSGTAVRLFNSNTTNTFAVTVSSANSANLNQTTAYANVSIGPLSEIVVYKKSTDFVTCANAGILAVSIALIS